MRRTLCVLVLGGLVPAGLAAQDLTTMTLEDALAIARRRNPSALEARTQVDAAALDVRAGYGTFLPSLSASMGWSLSGNTQLTGTDDFGRTVSLPDPITIRSSSASQRISASLRLFDGFQNLNRLRASRFSYSSAEAGVDIQYLQVEAEVAQRFYDAIAQERRIELEENLLASARERLDANERLFRVAAASQVDVLGAQVDVTRQEQRLDTQRGEARKARLRVLESLGVLDEITDFAPEGSFPAVFDPAVLVANELVATALESNPTVRQRDYQLSAASASRRVALGTWLPTIDLNGGWGRGLNQGGFGAFFDLNPGRDRGYNFSMSVSWPIFNGFQRQQQIGSASADLRRAEQQMRLIELQVEQQVRAALIDLESAHQALETQQRATQLSRTRVELAREQYLTGSLAFTNLQQIIDQASNDERGLVDAEFNYAVALVNLEQQVGTPVRP